MNDFYQEGILAAGKGRPHGIVLRDVSGRVRPWELERWFADSAPGDASILGRCSGPTLDVGCGPGRLTAALAAGGIPALGVDIAPAAVAEAVSRGAPVLHRSVFERIPAQGRWHHVLLVDGNLGIGGDPIALLRRCADLIAHAGNVLVELDPPGKTRTVTVRLESGNRCGQWFWWAHVGADTIDTTAAPAGLQVSTLWTEAGRWFASLTG